MRRLGLGSRCTRSASSAAALLGALLATASCTDAPVFELPPSPPMDHVTVYAWPAYVQVGDTLRVEAQGFYSTGYAALEPISSESWRAHPAGTLTLESAPRVLPIIAARYARGVAPGTAWVVATLNGLADSAAVEVLPQIARIELEPAAITMQVGDTVRVTARVVTSTGAELTEGRLSWESSHSNAVNFGRREPRAVHVVAWGPAVADVTVTLARATATLRVTAVSP